MEYSIHFNRLKLIDSATQVFYLVTIFLPGWLINTVREVLKSLNIPMDFSISLQLCKFWPVYIYFFK